MSRGPDKQFEPDVALEKAMQLFWMKGFAATGLAELQELMGIGRKSLYDTFGNKRQLFIKCLQHYSECTSRSLFAKLDDPGSPLANVKAVLRVLQEQHTSVNSSGCLYGVSMAQFRNDDSEMASILRGHLNQIEQAFFGAFKRAQQAGELRKETNIRDLSRFFVGILQGLALIGRVQEKPAIPRSIINAAFAALEAA